MNDLFDIACNFTHESFDDDLKQVINDAMAIGVSKFLLVAADLEDANKIDELIPVSYTHLRAHETPEHLVCRLLLEKKKKNNKKKYYFT